FRPARPLANSTVAACSTLLVAIYPVFFAQSSLAQVDLPAAGLIFWGLEAYFRDKLMGARVSLPVLIWFSLAALAKETAILVPMALALWELGSRWRNQKLSRAAAEYESPARQCR